MEIDELNILFRRFWAEVRTKTGKRYSVKSMNNLRYGIQRHLNGAPFNRNINLKSDAAFKTSNKMFTAQLRQLRELGLDTTTPKEAITSDDMAKFATNSTLDTPIGLQEAFFVTLMMHWARRGQEGLHLLTKSSFK